MAKKKATVSEEVENLRGVAKAINDVCYENPEEEGIDLELDDEDELRSAIEEAAADLTIEDKEDIDEDIWTWLEDEGMIDHLKKAKKGAKKEEAKPAAKGKKAAKEEESEEEEEEEEEEEKPAKGKKAAAKPAKKDADDEDKPKKKGFPKGPQNELGHLEGSQADAIDKLLLAGNKTFEQIEQSLMKKFDMTAGKAGGRLKAHIKHLEDAKGCSVDTDKKGIMSITPPKKKK